MKNTSDIIAKQKDNVVGSGLLYFFSLVFLYLGVTTTPDDPTYPKLQGGIYFYCTLSFIITIFTYKTLILTIKKIWKATLFKERENLLTDIDDIFKVLNFKALILLLIFGVDEVV